jgi:hypothetical protein
MGEAKRRAAAGGGRSAKLSEELREVLEPSIKDAARIAYAHQGEAAFEITERATSLHEAGHAVVGYAIAGDLPLQVSIGAQIRQSSLGSTHVVGWCPYGHDSIFGRVINFATAPPEETIAFAAQMLAGQTAEMVFDGDDYRLGSSLDDQASGIHALKSLLELRLDLDDRDSPKTLCTLTLQAVAKTLESNRTTVERIAAALIERRSLSRAEIAAMVADVRREPSFGESILSRLKEPAAEPRNRFAEPDAGPARMSPLTYACLEIDNA